MFVIFSAINRGEIKDTEMEMIMDTIVDSLFSVFATLGTHFLYLVLTCLLETYKFEEIHSYLVLDKDGETSDIMAHIP
jgi:hypothetical protein